MKKNSIQLVVVCLCCITFNLHGQESSKEVVVALDSKEKSSHIFKFEPDYMTSIASEREQQKRNKEIVDTLSISERKKKKLLKKTFKNDFSEYLSKTRVADTKFEDVEK
ncbi:hypothetical protein [uncultured Maribacter sp.]|uniref:hypothetical protein n=1 Tax=uncultured Maribacter sp. TaxID=431308 RepID=UPI00261EAEBF|nr:hypothetical protein [uncultured Maribacter sp.]